MVTDLSVVDSCPSLGVADRQPGREGDGEAIHRPLLAVRASDLQPGVLSWEAKTFFTRGQCHALALAISERTGWPLVGINLRATECDCEDADDPDGNWCHCESDEYFARHITVRHPNGRLVDVQGWVDQGGDWLFVDDSIDLTPADIDHLVAKGWYSPAQMAVARAFVDATLRLVESA